MPVGDRSGLVADWSTLVDIWERAAHLKVEQGKHDQGLVDFDSMIGRHRPKIGRCRLISTSKQSTHTPLQVQQGWGGACGEQGPWGGNQTFQSRTLANMILQSFVALCFRRSPSEIEKLEFQSWCRAACQWVISRDWSLIGRDKSTSGSARRALRWNGVSKIRDWSTSIPGLVDVVLG